MEFEISLKDIKFYAYHGVFDEERMIGNEFNVNLSVFIPYNPDMKSDELEYTLSYADLYHVVREEMHLPRKLLEKLILKISERLKKEFPQIIRGRISIEKVHPPVRGMLGSAVVSLNF